MRINHWPVACAMLAICGAAGAMAQPTTTPRPTAVPPDNSPLPPTTNPPSKPREEVPSKTGQIDLRPKFKAGQTIRYIFDQTAQNQLKSLDGGDNSMDQDQKQTERIGLTMKVLDSADEGATIQVVYESIKVSLTTPDGTAEYDSAKPAAPKNAPKTTTPTTTPRTNPTTRPAPPTSRPGNTNPRAPAQPDPNAIPSIPDPLKQLGDMDMSGMLGQMVGPMVGTVITVKTDKNGAITSVSGGDALGGGMGGLGGLGGGGGLLPSPTQMANWLVAGIGGPGNSGFATVGQTWTNTDTLSGTPIGALKMVTSHTLKSAFGGMANLSFTGHIEPPSETAQPPGGVGAQVQNAAYTGTYAWDTRSGSLSEMGTDMRVSMDAAMLGAKTRMTSTTQVKVKRQ